MIASKVLKNLVTAGSFGIIVYAKEAKEKGKEECDESRKLVKPSELPMYTPPPKPVLCRDEPQPSILYTTVSCARQELLAVLKQGTLVRLEIEDEFDVMLQKGQDVINYLREEENFVPRCSAISIAGLAGYVSAFKKGSIRRLFRSGLFAGVMAAICYPREAKEYAQEALQQAKKCVICAYELAKTEEEEDKTEDPGKIEAHTDSTGQKILGHHLYTNKTTDND